MNLEQRFFNLSPDLYCVTDIHGFIQQVNPAFEKILGFAASEVLTQPYLALVHLDDVPATIEALEALKRGISTSYHNRYRCKDGSERLVEWIAEPVLEEGVEERLIYMVGRDVTTQKQLQEEQERFLAIGADLLSIGTFDGFLTWVNPSWEKTLGWTKEELTAYPWLHFVHPEDHEKTLQAGQELVAGVELISFENRYLCKDGSYRWISWRSRPFPDERLIYGAAVDITERKLAEMSAQEALRESEERYRTFVNTVSSIVWTTNGEGSMVEKNPLWEKFTGQTREEYKDWGWLNERKAREEREQLLKALEQEQVRLRAVLDNIPVAVVLAEGPEGKIVMANKQTEEIFRHPVFYSTDYNSYHEWESYDAEGRRTESHEYPLAKVFATGKPYQNEYHYQRGDGTRAWVRIMGAPINDRDGKLIAAVVAITDIDSQKQEQERRERLLESERAARMETERVGKMKDEFLITLSHELRTPLNAILGWSQILSKNNVSADRMQQGLDAIGRNVRNQSQLIEDLLDVSRIISGKIQLNVELVNMTSVIEAALETVRLSADAKGIELETLFDPLSCIVSGDSARLQQIIWNLLSNAIKFTPKNGKVQIVLKHVDSRVQVSVIDTGQGIKPEFLPHVFERFSQADGSTTRKYGGLGLGLSIVRGLTELHGGTVWVTSVGESMGATFTVSLPIAPIRSNVTSSKNSDRNQVTDDEFDYSESLVLSGVKVLVVDDEPDAREVIRCVLEDALANVVTAESAQNALELISQEQPDVLVSDIGMPDEDGYDLIRKVRSLPSNAGGRIPAVALTAYARAEDRKRALLAGYQMHISKPVEASELIAIISSLTSLMTKRD